MPKLRKMLTDINAPYLISLMRCIETQSIETIANWGIDYAEMHLLPLWQQSYPEDVRPLEAIEAARDYLVGNLKLSDAKKQIIQCRSAARETEGMAIPQGAARTIDAVTSAIHNPAGSLGLALYGALTLAYNQIGISASWEELEAIAAGECAKMEEALHKVMVENEANQAKIKWNC